MPHQTHLQGKAHQRRAEHCRGIHIIGTPQRPAQQRLTLLRGFAGLAQATPGEQQADQHIDQEKRHQEGFTAPQQLRLVGAPAPGQADTESADKTDQVERSPGLEPGHRKNPGIEQEEIAEQRDMIAAAAGGKDWRGKAAQCRRHRQALGILCHREHTGSGRHQHQQGKGRLAIEQRMQTQGGKDGQVQHRHPGALQQQGIAGAPHAQPPAEAEQGQGAGGHCAVTQRHGHHHALRGIAQQEGQAEEQQQQADTQHRVATQ